MAIVFQPGVFQPNVFQSGDVVPPVVTSFVPGDISSAFVVDSSGTRPLKKRIPLEWRRQLLAELRRKQRVEAQQRGDSMYATRVVAPHSTLRKLVRE